MNITEILPGIHYVGVNDRTTTRFEGLWSLPQGVSYNAYLVCLLYTSDAADEL